MNSATDLKPGAPSCAPKEVKKTVKNRNLKVTETVTDPNALKDVSESPSSGKRCETPAGVSLAIAKWGEIFAISDMDRLLKTLKANTAEAVELECENRTIPRRTMKTRFPFPRPRFLGEACFTDTKEYKVNGVRKFCQIFYTRESRYTAVL